LIWTILITFQDQQLYGRRGRVAESAARTHFEQAGCTPYEAAEAAWKQEGEACPLTDQQEVWAEVWRCAPDVVASALGLHASDIDVELRRDPVAL
jgi:hypothetical protein